MTSNAFQNTRRYERQMEKFLESGEEFEITNAPIERIRSYNKIIKRRRFPIEVSTIQVERRTKVCFIRGE